MTFPPIDWRPVDPDGSAAVPAYRGDVDGHRMFLLSRDPGPAAGWWLRSRLGEPDTAYPVPDQELGRLLAHELLLALIHTFGPGTVRAMIRKKDPE